MSAGVVVLLDPGASHGRPTDAKAPTQSCHSTGQRPESLETWSPELPEADSISELLADSKASWREQQLGMVADKEVRACPHPDALRRWLRNAASPGADEGLKTYTRARH